MTIQSFEPRTGRPYASSSPTSSQQVNELMSRAQSAAPRLARLSPEVRRGWLDAVADELIARSEEIVLVADAETGLGRVRLEAEVQRTAAQLRYYGAAAQEGSYLDATLDNPVQGTPSLVRTGVPLGPVIVFDASNFPLFMGVLGNDSASALAAGCPVIVKVHGAHLRLGELLCDVAAVALEAQGAPEGTFGAAYGREAGTQLVQHPGAAAVGFTGSQAVGLHLWRLANDRPRVIPVYAEMGTVNPVLVTPSAAGRRMAQIAEDFVAGFTAAWGQYCTKPGLLLAPKGSDAANLVGRALEAAGPEPLMLTEQIADAVVDGLDELETAGGTVIARASSRGEGWSAPAAVVSADPESLVAGSRLLEECFGAVSVVVEYDGLEQLSALVPRLSGSLGASVLVDENDPDGQACVALVAAQVGRVIVNGWATGAAFTWAQQHGGPWPATSAPSTTSIGAGSLARWTRPVAFQAMPDEWVPHPVKADNPWGITRRVDGQILPAHA